MPLWPPLKKAVLHYKSSDSWAGEGDLQAKPGP
jgi:hypothetical protein